MGEKGRGENSAIGYTLLSGTEETSVWISSYDQNVWNNVCSRNAEFSKAAVEAYIDITEVYEEFIQKWMFAM